MIATLPKYAPEGAVIPDGSMPSVSLLRRYGVDSVTLIRWEGYGWIEPLWPRSGSGGGRELWWGPWAVRMVALVAGERRRQGPTVGWPRQYAAARRALFAAVAEVLHDWPDVVWLVDISPDPLAPELVCCWTAEQVVSARKIAPPICRVIAPPFVD